MEAVKIEGKWSPDMTNAESRAWFDQKVSEFRAKHGYYPGWAAEAYKDPQVQEIRRETFRRLQRRNYRLRKQLKREFVPLLVMQYEYELASQIAFQAAGLATTESSRIRLLNRAWDLAKKSLDLRKNNEAVGESP